MIETIIWEISELFIKKHIQTLGGRDSGVKERISICGVVLSSGPNKFILDVSIGNEAVQCPRINCNSYQLIFAISLPMSYLVLKCWAQVPVIQILGELALMLSYTTTKVAKKFSERDIFWCAIA